MFTDASLENEIELEERLLNSPDLIEEGFKLLINQRRTSPHKKRLDLLGVDSNGTLTVIELKIKEDKDQLPQAIEYFDWLLERGISFFRDYFSEEKIENKTPRIILVAPEYSDRTIKLSKYISENIEISLKKYFVFEIKGEKYIKLYDEKIPSIYEIEQPPATLEDHINYFTDKKVKTVFKNTVDKILNLDEEKVRISLLPYRINFIHTSSGLKFAELYRRKKYFMANWKEPDAWYSINEIKTEEEIDEIINDNIKKAMEFVIR